MNRPFLISGYLLYGLCLIFVVVGAWTLTFSKTEGVLIEHGQSKSMLTGGFPGVPRGNSDSTYADQFFARYSYVIDDRKFESERIGVGLNTWTMAPLWTMNWIRISGSTTKIPVYY